jgi:hypothetical protein
MAKKPNPPTSQTGKAKQSSKTQKSEVSNGRKRGISLEHEQMTFSPAPPPGPKPKK